MENLIDKIKPWTKYGSKSKYNDHKLQETMSIEKLLDSPALHWTKPKAPEIQTYQSRVGGPKENFDKIINAFTEYCLKNRKIQAFGQTDFYNSLRFSKETNDKIYYDVIPYSVIWLNSGYR